MKGKKTTLLNLYLCILSLDAMKKTNVETIKEKYCEIKNPQICKANPNILAK